MWDFQSIITSICSKLTHTTREFQGIPGTYLKGGTYLSFILLANNFCYQHLILEISEKRNWGRVSESRIKQEAHEKYQTNAGWQSLKTGVDDNENETLEMESKHATGRSGYGTGRSQNCECAHML